MTTHIKLAHIIRATTEVTGVPKHLLAGPSRVRTIVGARQMAMYVARHLTDRSLPEIGRQVGGKDHTTVLHAIRVVEPRVAHLADDRAIFEAICDRARELARNDAPVAPVCAPAAELDPVGTDAQENANARPEQTSAVLTAIPIPDAKLSVRHLQRMYANGRGYSTARLARIFHTSEQSVRAALHLPALETAAA